MKDVVLIKGNQYGLTIILDKIVDFVIIKKALYKKINEAKKFFGQAKVSITFKGRDLTDDEQKILVNIIGEASDLEVICIIDDTEKDLSASKLIRQKEKIVSLNTAIFHRGTLRSGQEIIVDSSIIIMGDVNPGAKVIAKGNVIVVGSLKGYAHAGENGEKSAFVVALDMKPTQIRIGKVIARSPDKFEKAKTEPKIAFLENNQIFIEDINNDIYNELKLINYN
jgi:septum site-determining protein MinC